MATSLTIPPTQANLKYLTADEQQIYQNWIENKTKPPLAVGLSLKMFELFLNGASCEEISKVNNHLYTLGQIYEARISHGWDERKDKYLAELFGGVVDRVKQTQMEAVTFTSDLLSVAHKQFGTKLKLYLQSGDEKDLGELSLTNLSSYTKTAELLMKLTGQDKKTEKMTMAGPVSVGDKATELTGEIVPGGTERLDSGLAMKVLQFLEAKDEEK